MRLSFVMCMLLCSVQYPAYTWQLTQQADCDNAHKSAHKQCGLACLAAFYMCPLVCLNMMHICRIAALPCYVGLVSAH